MSHETGTNAEDREATLLAELLAIGAVESDEDGFRAWEPNA
jgi:hypothetical protein